MKQYRWAFEAAEVAILTLIAVGLVMWDVICGLHVPIVICLFGSSIFLGLTYFPMSFLLRHRHPGLSGRRTLAKISVSPSESVGPTTMLEQREVEALDALEAVERKKDPLLNHKLMMIQPLGFAMHADRWRRKMRSRLRRLRRHDRLKKPRQVPAAPTTIEPTGYIVGGWMMGLLFSPAYWHNLYSRMRGRGDDRKE